MPPAKGCRRRIVDALNHSGACLQRFAPESNHFDLESIVAKAVRTAQLDDFGDTRIFSGLRMLLESYENNAELSFLGRVAMHHNTVSLLVNRLRLEQNAKRHTEIYDEEISAPIFILGLPRSGTTLLHNLLNQDDCHYSPAGWEVMYPRDHTTSQRSNNPKKRHNKAHHQMRLLTWLSPGIDALHAIDAAAPQECIAITGLSFESYLFQTMCKVTDYQTWLETRDLVCSYRYHRFFLQNLQFRRPPKTWILKAPAHLFAVDAILQVYPDARFVQLHREPMAAITSTASLTYYLRRAFSDRVDPVAIGTEVAQRWSQALQQSSDVRRQTPDLQERYLDLRYEDLVRNPISTLATIYGKFNKPFDDKTLQRTNHYLAHHPKEKFGVHKYQPDTFGFNRDMLQRHFSSYSEDFSLAG